MGRQTPASQVETLKAQQRALIAKLREAQAKARADENEVRRKKYELAGQIAVAALDTNPKSPFAIAFRELLNSGLKRTAQRALFALPPLPEAEATESAPPDQSGGAGGD